MRKKHLPLGIQNFEEFKEKNLIYVDKTPLIYELVNVPKGLYFLSRPRRFGKTLLLSTLACLFQGRKELFKDLWIYSQGKWDWKTHPVISIDFNRMDHQNPKALEKSLHETLNTIIEKKGLRINSSSLPMKLADVIVALEQQAKASVVILIDEYDKPIISHLGKGDAEEKIARDNRDLLKQFFGALKAYDAAGSLGFVFLTGVSKFTRVSVFSDLNNLNDITMQQKYTSLLGYTETELYHYFKDHIQELACDLKISEEECKIKLRHWYNGYRFSKKELTLYNPFSILNLFTSGEFRNFWYETGTPSFLLNLIKTQDYPIPEVEKLELDESSFSSFEIEKLRIEALLFQTGYLTISHEDQLFYTLDYPNQEVKSSFMKNLYDDFIEIKSLRIKNSFKLLVKYLKVEKYDEFITVVNDILSSITYHQISNQNEAYFHTIFYLMLSASGVDVLTEVLTSQGRIDMAVFIKNRIYIIELKCNQTAEKAIAQIKKQNYAKKYKNQEKSIILMGINFDSKKRKIDGWKLEELD